MFETGIKMRLKTELSDHWVVMAVDVGVHAVHSFEYLSNHVREGFWELNA